MFILVASIVLICLFAIIFGIISKDYWINNVDDKDFSYESTTDVSENVNVLKEKQIIPSIKKSWHFDAQEDVSTKYVKESTSKAFDPFYDTITTISAGNQYLDAHEKLNISIFEKELNEDKVNEAYEKLLNEHIRNIKKGKSTEFNIEEIKKAKTYLIEWLGNQK
jgi:hypothetical protein